MIRPSAAEIAPQGHFLALRAQGATAPLGPRNDKSESFTPQNAYRKSCQSAWRSASALYRGIKPQEGTGAPRVPLTCHCEERSDVAISQYTVGSWESYRRKRNCLPEIATAPLGPRNDKLGGVCHFDGGLYGLQVRRREGHAAPLQRITESYGKNSTLHSQFSPSGGRLSPNRYLQ